MTLRGMMLVWLVTQWALSKASSVVFFFFKCCYPSLVDLIFIVVRISFLICTGLFTTDDLQHTLKIVVVVVVIVVVVVVFISKDEIIKKIVYSCLRIRQWSQHSSRHLSLVQIIRPQNNLNLKMKLSHRRISKQDPDLPIAAWDH